LYVRNLPNNTPVVMFGLVGWLCFLSDTTVYH
jgi:hypothetical protein